MNTEGVPLIALSLVLLAVVAEVIWSRRRGVALYSRNETLASLAVGAMNRLGGLVTLAVKYAAIAFVARFVPWELPDKRLDLHRRIPRRRGLLLLVPPDQSRGAVPMGAPPRPPLEPGIQHDDLDPPQRAQQSRRCGLGSPPWRCSASATP